MIINMRIVIPAIVILVLVAAVSCSGQDSVVEKIVTVEVTKGGAQFQRESAGPEEEVVRIVEVEKIVTVEVEVVREVAMEVEKRVVLETEFAAIPTPGPGTTGAGEAFTEEDVASLVVQERIIVRTVDMDLEVPDVSAAMDDVADLALELGGWVVGTDRRVKHQGFVSIRVPADRLDEAILRLRDMADDVKSEVTNSRDVTDEYVDLGARLKNQQVTEEALIRLLDRAEDVEAALQVQQTLTRTQEEIERLQGRIAFLEQTSAFSLLSVSLRLSPLELEVDGGIDQAVSVGVIARFRASFKPPEDMDEFSFTWDFGDGSPLIRSVRTAPTTDEDTRVTATVTHIYGDDRDSPFIAEVEITASGDIGVAEGSDTLIVSVTRVPTIDVFAGESRSVGQGQEIEFSGSFTRPEGLSEVAFEWDFGDGSAPATGSLEDGATTAAATHAYPDHRPRPFTATLTITGKSDSIDVEGSGSVSVFVSEGRGWTIVGWSIGESIKGGVRGLSAVGLALAIFGLWVGIFSPLWIVGIAAIVWVRRRGGRQI